MLRIVRCFSPSAKSCRSLSKSRRKSRDSRRRSVQLTGLTVPLFVNLLSVIPDRTPASATGQRPLDLVGSVIVDAGSPSARRYLGEPSTLRRSFLRLYESFGHTRSAARQTCCRIGAVFREANTVISRLRQKLGARIAAMAVVIRPGLS